MTHKYKIGQNVQLTKWDYSQVTGVITELTTLSINDKEVPTYQIKTDAGIEGAYEPDIQIIKMDAGFIQSLKELKTAMCNVWENWPDDDGNIPVLVDNYPFNQSFDELTMDVATWIDKINSSLTNQTT